MVLLHEHTSAKSRDDVTLLHGLDCFSPRFRTPSSIAQSKCSIHHQKFNHPRLDTNEHDSTQPKFNKFILKKVLRRPYPRPRVSRNRSGFFLRSARCLECTHSICLPRCAQPYRSSLRATVANQHHRWARAAIEFYFATLQVHAK